MPAPEGLSEVIALLECTIVELKAQLANLHRELKQVRRSEPYAVMKDLQEMRSAGVDPASSLKAEAQARVDDLRAVRDCVAEFNAGKMSWESFLDGPELPSDFDDEEADAAVDDLVGMLLEELEQFELTRRRRRSRSRGSSIPF